MNKELDNSKVKSNIRIIPVLMGTALILLIPLIAMQFSDEVDWGLFDFMIIATLLIGTGLAYELLVRVFKTTSKRIILAVIVFVAVALVWGELAVGIFGTPFAGN